MGHRMPAPLTLARMKLRPLDPRHLDVAGAARDQARLEGQWPLSGFERLRSATGVEQGDGHATWSAVAEARPARGGGHETRLHLVARATLGCECQRCLQPVAVAIGVDRWFLFVADEKTAAALDAELDPDSDLDVLALPRHLDLHALLEDELLLALPLVPRHDACPHPLPLPADDVSLDAPEDASAHPFAGLAALKRRNGSPG